MPDEDDLEGVSDETTEPEFENDYEAALAELLADMDDDERAEVMALAEDSADEVGRAVTRFDRLVAKLRKRGVANPEGLARWIGERKYTPAGYAALVAKGRAKAKARRARKAMRSRAFGHDEIIRFERYWPADIEIVRGGSGREVTAYAAVFDTPNEIQDQHGHYMEVIERSAFNRTLSQRGPEKVALLLNHGYHPDGSPLALASVPLGSFIEIKPDGKGLLTRARYNKTELADAVLEAIRHGDIRGYSFRGRVFRSNPMRVPRIQRGGALPTVYRQELGLSDAGPTQSPWYSDASIVAIRSQAIASQAIAEARRLPERERIIIARALLADDPIDDDTGVDENEDVTPERDDSAVEPDEGTTESSTTPDDESDVDDESTEDIEVEDPEDESPTDSDESPGTEGPPEEAPLPVSQAARSISAAEVARKARVALILRGGK